MPVMMAVACWAERQLKPGTMCIKAALSADQLNHVGRESCIVAGGVGPPRTLSLCSLVVVSFE